MLLICCQLPSRSGAHGDLRKAAARGALEPREARSGHARPNGCKPGSRSRDGLHPSISHDL